MSERESWEKELEALGRDSAAEGAEPVETAAGETETGAEQSFAEEAEERARAAERDFERRLEKAIDRRIRNICLKTFAVAAAVCMVVFLIVSPVGVFFPTPQHVGGMGSASLEEYLGAYYETTRPYVELVPANDQQRRAWTQNRGFGCYTVGLNVLDGKQYWARTGESNVQVTLDRGRFAVKNDPERVLVRDWNAFNYRDSVEGVRADLEGLPRTSYGYISVRANAPVSIETLRESGLEGAILKKESQGVPILGICGGYQMLGQVLRDPLGVEEGGSLRGLGLLPIETDFLPQKTRTQTQGRITKAQGFFAPLEGCAFQGYEIHMGETRHLSGDPAAALTGEGWEKQDGASQGNVLGTYVHGILDGGELAQKLVSLLFARKGLDPQQVEQMDYKAYKEQQYDILADAIRRSLDMDKVYQILEEGAKEERP